VLADSEQVDGVVLTASDAVASHVAAQLAAAGRSVVVIADDLASSELRAVEAVHGVVLVARADGPSAVRDAIQALAADDPQATTTSALSTQELRVLELTARGRNAKQIADELNISPGSVSAYLRRIRAKYHRAGRPAPSKIDLYRRAIEDGLLD
jgi:DNA-binding NarL/FixJ family response regulator